MRKVLAVGVLCVAFAHVAYAVPKGICPTGTEGHWVIVSEQADANITAMTDAEASRFIGREIVISGKMISYDGHTCRDAVSEVEPLTDYDENLQGDPPGYKYIVGYKCPSDKAFFYPDVSIGKRCDRAFFVRDGMAFGLRRKH